MNLNVSLIAASTSQ